MRHRIKEMSETTMDQQQTHMKQISTALQQAIARDGTGGACIAFSGGVDSAVVLALALKQNIRVLAVTFHTFLHPHGDLDEAKELAQELGAEHVTIQINEMDNPNVLNNPPDRCYHCKHMLFETLCNLAAERGLDCVMDGTNADDLKQYRPGLRALKQLGVKSPLAACGVDKKTVRAIAQELGLCVASKPSAPCLATRLPYGHRLEIDLMRRIDQAEQYLKSLGFSPVRLRCHHDIARIEIPPTQFPLAVAHAHEMTEALKGYGFLYITLDLEGFRTGSMDIFQDDPPGSKE